MHIFKWVLVSILLLFASAISVELPSLFTDNMVLQQNQKVKIWGTSEAGEQVKISASWGATASTTVSGSGKWVCDLTTPAAGGPFTVIINDDSGSVELTNVLVGEVWFCSGQSNMEMPLSGWLPNDPIKNSEQEIKNADYPLIRMFTVARNASFTPQTDVNGSWLECTPQTVPGFSATAYFFGRKLFNELNVPIGLIHSSWGGTPAQAWMEESWLKKYDEYKKILDQIDGSRELLQKYRAWLDKLPSIEREQAVKDGAYSEFDLKDEAVPQVDFDDSRWHEMELPRLWETTEPGSLDGVVWFRKTISLPDAWVGKELVLELGPVDDMDATWFNGKRVGSHLKSGYWQEIRKYSIPQDLVKKENTIAVRVIDTQGGGGIYGRSEQMKIYPTENDAETVSLAGAWKYLPAAIYKNARFYTLDIATMQFYQQAKIPVEENPNTPSTLYNGMVHPVVPYTIKGAIWYQGESNVGNPSEYEELFPDLIRNWREVWGLGEFPFYFVQIAPWNYGGGSMSQALRDAQRKSLQVKNTGMAITVDIGDVRTIHPANKQDVGLRLALWALAKDYGKEVVYSGPLYKSMKRDGNKIIISFDHCGEGLKFTGAENNFLIAGEDKEFKPAITEINNDKIVVYHSQIRKPLAVRYLWDNTSAGTLFNSAGLPASSFRTDDWDN
jgi:sialate O-acetylesterase